MGLIHQHDVDINILRKYMPSNQKEPDIMARTESTPSAKRVGEIQCNKKKYKDLDRNV